MLLVLIDGKAAVGETYPSRLGSGPLPGYGMKWSSSIAKQPTHVSNMNLLSTRWVSLESDN